MKISDSVGYHYTSFENWLGIKEDGLIPYEIKHDFSEWFDGKIYGVWLWKHKGRGRSGFGSLIDRLIKLNTKKVVLLEVKYKEKDRLAKNGEAIYLTHDGSLGNLVYHKRKESVIVTKRITPKNIKLLRIYDFTGFF
jgi:hypothetical protein